MKKIVIPDELAYIFATVLLALSVCFCTASDFGVSMIVAPSYILSLKFPFITFGQWEYITQGILFILFCLMMKRFHWTYLSSFFTCLFYGAVLDLWRLIPIFNPNVTEPGSMNIGLRIFFFAISIPLCGISIAIFNRTYLYPEVVDMVPRGALKRFHTKFYVVKYIFDFSYFAIGLILSFSFFGKVEGIGWGTLVLLIVNSFVIDAFIKLLDRFFEFKPIFTRFASNFDF